MAGTFTLRVITPDRIALDTQVSSVRLPGVDGSIGVLPRHAHMIAALKVGLVQYVEDGSRKSLFVSDGFAEVKDGTLRIVAEAGELPSEIDVERAKRAEQRARERLQAKGDVDGARAAFALQRALIRQQLMSGAGV